MQSTLSHLQFPQGNCSTTSHRTLRALQDAHARGARRLVTLLALSLVSAVEPVRFLAWSVVEAVFFAAFEVVSVTSGVELSAGPSPGVEADSEREWNSASLVVIVFMVGFLSSSSALLRVHRFVEWTSFARFLTSYVQRDPNTEWRRTSSSSFFSSFLFQRIDRRG